MPTFFARGRTAALAFIFVTVLIDMLAFGVIIPVLPHLIKQFVGGDYSLASYWIAGFGTLFAAIQFFSTPIQGALSDRFGRRPVILLSCLGLGVDFIAMALAPSLAWLFVGRVFSGVFSASITTANAYIADVTPPAQRAKSYGFLGAAFGLGFILGPVIGGQLSHYGLRFPFWFAAALALLNFAYGLFVLPESLAPEHRARRFDWSHANPFGSLKLLASYPQVFGLAAVVFIANLAHYVYPSVFVIYADYRYGWEEDAVSWVLGVVGVLGVIVNVVVVGWAVRRFGERRALLYALCCGVIGFAIYGYAWQGWMFLIGLPISALWAVAAPATQALITSEVGPQVQGRIQGALMSLVSMAGIVGPTLYAGSFGYFIGPESPVHLPGAPFYVAAILLTLAVFVAWRVAPRDVAAAQHAAG